MNQSSDFNRLLSAWLADEAPAQAPGDVLSGAVERVGRQRQRPAWRIPERWISMQTTMRMTTFSRGALYAMVILLLAALLAIAVYFVGQQHHLPPALGLAANGLIAEDANGQINLISPTGEAVRTLTTNAEIAMAPVFSSDGQHVAFWTMPRPPTLAVSASEDDIIHAISTGTASIVSVDAATGARTTIASGVAMSNPDLSWSHKGDAIAYTAQIVNGYNRVYVASTRDSSQIGSIDFAVGPTWSPDDGLIAYSKDTVGVFVADPDGSNQRQISQANGLDFAFYRPEWSPDGTKIAFMAGDQPGYSIVVARVDGSAESTVASSADGKQVYWPHFSPDGTKLAYQRLVSSNADGDLVNWVVANPDGSNPRQLAVNIFPDSTQGWSPDGRYLVGYNSSSGVTNILLIDATSGAVQRIPRDGTNSVSWQRLAP
jgi:Tol biopolymer transport system component